MDAVLFLCSMLYADDVAELGNKYYPAREAAHVRLARAKSSAVPALLAGMRTACPERQMRCEMLLGAAGWDVQRGAWGTLFVRPWKVATARLFIITEKEYHKFEANIPPDPFLTALARDDEQWLLVHAAATASGWKFWHEIECGYTPNDYSFSERYWLLWGMAKEPKTKKVIRNVK